MKTNPSAKLKAVILLFVFSLNTVLGFACSLGVDMGYNSTHHHQQEATEAVVHIHKDGKRHIHHEKKEKHGHNKSHQHDHKANHKSDTGKDDCCSDEVKKFADLDKAIPKTGKAPVVPIFFHAFVSSFYTISVTVHSQSTPDIKQFVRSYHPPIPDIRIAVQSFQI